MKFITFLIFLFGEHKITGNSRHTEAFILSLGGYEREEVELKKNYEGISYGSTISRRMVELSSVFRISSLRVFSERRWEIK